MGTRELPLATHVFRVLLLFVQLLTGGSVGGRGQLSSARGVCVIECRLAARNPKRFGTAVLAVVATVPG